MFKFLVKSYFEWDAYFCSTVMSIWYIFAQTFLKNIMNDGELEYNIDLINVGWKNYMYEPLHVYEDARFYLGSKYVNLFGKEYLLCRVI